MSLIFFFFQAEDGIRDWSVTGVQTCALPIWSRSRRPATARSRRPAIRRSSPSQPDRDRQVADLPEDLRARRAAPAMEQEVDRGIADAEVRQGDLAEPVGQVRVTQLELLLAGVRPQSEHRLD